MQIGAKHLSWSAMAIGLFAQTALLAGAIVITNSSTAQAQVGDSDRPQNRKSTTKSASPRPKTPKATPPVRKPSTAAKGLIVSPSGPYRSIGDAIADSPSGGRITVRPGTYSEGVIVDRGIQLIAEGAVEDVRIESPDKDGILIDTDEPVTIRGFTIRSVAGRQGAKFYGIDIPQGRPIIQDCDISSDSLASIAIHTRGTNPTIQRCQIVNGAAGGVFIYEGAQGKIEDCNIWGHELANVEIKDGSYPSFLRVKIHDGAAGGIFLNSGGSGVFEDCDVYRNTLANVEIRDPSKPVFRRCKMREGKQGGIYVYGNGQGTFENCDIVGNSLAGVEVKTGGAPTLRNCRITGGKVSGLFIGVDGLGLIENCDISGNTFAGLEIRERGNPVVRGTRIHSGQQGGVFVYEGGRGTIEDCDIVENTRAGIEIKSFGNPLFRRCRINRNGYEGVWVYERGAGTFEYCDVSANQRGAWDVSADATVKRVGNRE
ncbi:MAG: right-handed parallel beta-helix repeat-containing protein [Blastocatellia bacterium]|nr:right-handed parallel beta-helix repeat-containing protein [Blastocatellia bacterium]